MRASARCARAQDVRERWLNDHFDAMGIPVISGHRDTHFNFMKNLDEGDLLRLERYDGNSASYVVNRLFVVNGNSIRIDTSGVGPQALILITCWPVDSPVPGGKERWVVEAHRTIQSARAPFSVPGTTCLAPQAPRMHGTVQPIRNMEADALFC